MIKTSDPAFAGKWLVVAHKHYWPGKYSNCPGLCGDRQVPRLTFGSGLGTLTDVETGDGFAG